MRPHDWLLPGVQREPGQRPRVVALGGDGIGPEVVEAAVRCLECLRLPFDIDRPLHGATASAELGTPYPEAARAAVDAADAVLFGAADTSAAGYCRPILRHLRFGLDTYANVRPAVSLPGVAAITGDARTNLVIIRELTEDLYPGCEGDLAELGSRWPELRDRIGRQLPRSGKFALRITTEQASRRVGAYAGRLAAHRRALGVSRGHVTLVGKANVLEETDRLFFAACERELSVIDGVTWDTLHVDEAARRLVAQPFGFDVVLTTNLFGDILSDVAAEVMGGLPVAPSGAIGDSTAYFEPCHGSAPDIVGRGVANPAGAILSSAMMLVYLGFPAESARLTEATERALASLARADELQSSGFCRRLTDRVCAGLV